MAVKKWEVDCSKKYLGENSDCVNMPFFCPRQPAPLHLYQTTISTEKAFKFTSQTDEENCRIVPETFVYRKERQIQGMVVQQSNDTNNI